MQHPLDLEAQCELAFLEANSGHLDEAQELTRKIVDQNPLFSRAYGVQALIYEEKGDVAQAVSQLKKVLYLTPDDIMANFKLSVLFQKQGLSNEAGRYRLQAIKLAGKLQPDEIISDSDHLNGRDFLDMAQR